MTERERELERELIGLRHDVDNLANSVNWLLAIIGLFVVGSVVFSFADQWRSRRSEDVVQARAGEAHILSMEAARLAIRGEGKAQERAELVHAAFLDSSRETLTLVNDTLALAKEASERAARTVEDKARTIVDGIDEQARELISRMYLKADFKAIVEDPDLSARVQEIASELASIEGYLRVQGITLSAACLFVRGMDRHLKEEPRQAIQQLRRADEQARQPDSRDHKLAAYANYWIGYESNNLGDYVLAVDIFRQLIDMVVGDEQVWEIRRIWIESDFFRIAKLHRDTPIERAAEQQARVEEALECEKRLREDFVSLPTNLRDVASSVLTLRGNIFTWAARVTGNAAYWRDAATVFEEAGESLWPRFGLLEARVALGEPVNPAAYQWVADRVQERVTWRREARSKVLLFATRLIAYCRMPERSAADLESAWGDVLGAMGRVNNVMLVYSQFKKFNLPITEVGEELRNFYTEHVMQRRASS